MRYAAKSLESIDSLVKQGRFIEARALSEACGIDLEALALPSVQHRYLRGKIFRNLGSYAEAEREYLCAATAFSRLGEEEAAADALSGAALVRWHICDFSRATGLQIEALRVYEKIGDSQGAANSENTLGLIAWKRKDHGEAKRRFESAMGLYESLSHAQGLAATVNNLGGVLEDTEDLEGSERYYRQAVFYYGKSGDEAGVALASGNLSWVLARLAKVEEARSFAERATQAFAALGDRAGFFRALMQEGQVQRASGLSREAARTLYRAAHGAKLVGNAELEAVTIEDLIEVLGELGLHARVGAWYRRLMRLEAGFLSAEREREILRLGIDFEVEVRKRRGGELEAALRGRDRILSMLSHDFRAGIGQVRGSLASLRFELPALGEAETRSRLLDMEEEARVLEEGFDAMLTWARSRSGSLEPEIVDVSLAPLVESCLAAARRPLAARGIEAVAERSLAGASVRADRRMLAIVVNNLLGNVAKHGAPGARLKISLEAGSGSRMALLFRNEAPKTGEKADPAAARKSADPSSGASDGLGLELCADLAARMGGAFAFSISGTEALARLELERSEGGAASTS